MTTWAEVDLMLADLRATVCKPWCDCKKVAIGFTKRDDGCWVRPCCMRRTKDMFDKYGDNPLSTQPVHSVNKEGATS